MPVPEIIVQYWWVSLFSVPALAIVFKLLAERTGLVDQPSAFVRSKLADSEFSYPGHWVVTATLRDGRRFSRVVIDRRFRLVSDAALPFRLRDLEDVAWEGFVDAPRDPAVQLSEGRPDAG